jgi:hypothetical protein
MKNSKCYGNLQIYNKNILSGNCKIFECFLQLLATMYKNITKRNILKNILSNEKNKNFEVAEG